MAKISKVTVLSASAQGIKDVFAATTVGRFVRAVTSGEKARLASGVYFIQSHDWKKGQGVGDTLLNFQPLVSGDVVKLGWREALDTANAGKNPVILALDILNDLSSIRKACDASSVAIRAAVAEAATLAALAPAEILPSFPSEVMEISEPAADAKAEVATPSAELPAESAQATVATPDTDGMIDFGTFFQATSPAEPAVEPEAPVADAPAANAAPESAVDALRAALGGKKNRKARRAEAQAAAIVEPAPSTESPEAPASAE